MIFRPEAVAAQQQQQLGRIHLNRLVSVRVATFFVVAALAATILFLALGEYTRKARLTGQLVPDLGLNRILAPQLGTVLESHASEGRSVRRGDVLFVLEVGPSSQAGDVHAAVRTGVGERRRQLETAADRQGQIDQARQVTLAGQIAALRREGTQLDAEVVLQRQRVALTEAAQARIEALRGENFVSSAQVQAKAEESIAARAGLQSLQRQGAALQRQIGAIESELRELPLRSRAQRDDIDRALATLAQEAAENDARRQLVVRAPIDGTVSGVLAQAGQSVRSGAPLANLLPADARLQAHLYAPSSAIGFLREDQAVQLRYQAFPYQKFGHQPGRVVQVSRAPLPPSELAGTVAEPMYRVTVRLDGQTIEAYGAPHTLAAGMQLEADVMLDRRRLVEWIFEPVLGITGRVAGSG